MSTRDTVRTGLLAHGGWREFVRLAAEAAGVGCAVSLALLCAALLIASAADAATPQTPSSGTLLLQGTGEPVAAPLLATDVAIDVAGIVARTRVTQRFVNPSGDWREAVYVFPLPEDAAVDHLDIRIGTRRIVGVIRERGAARKAYEEAKQSGRKAALVDQERPNLFTTRAAAIGPGEEVEVSIEYQQALRFADGAFSLAFPLAITPRYIPGTPLALPLADGGRLPDTDEVDDASRITPPVVHPRHGKVNPVTLAVHVAAGVPLGRIESRHHAARVTEAPGYRYTVTLDGPVPADRDFVLVWVPEAGSAPAAAVFGETHEGRGYALAMLIPTVPDVALPRVAREITFVVDTSGSMSGNSIVQAKAALMAALGRLQPGDRFNVIEFNSHARALFAAPLPVDPATLGRARSFVSALRADGGTEMREALVLALAPGEAPPGLVRQVVFLTDGAVGNEDALFALIRERLGTRRLFTVGIGSAPNGHFMRKAAQFGRGTHTSIGNVDEVQARMGELFRKLESPVLTDVAIDWPAGTEAWPRVLPDLHAGEPLVAVAALPALDGEVVVRGRFAGRPWSARLPLAAAAGHEGVHGLWARAKIDALADAQVAGANADDVRAEIVRVALAHHLVSRYTSLVAVDATPTMPAGIEAVRTALPGNLPHGQEYEAIVGALPQTATPAARHLAMALLALAAALLTLGWSHLAVARPR
jgi:Ca-activated chloride channel family protein